MRLYHYTCLEHWKRIKAEGRIRTTESNLSMVTPHAGPDVVWLTDDPNPMKQEWKMGSAFDKSRVKITVAINDAKKWRRWATSKGINFVWMKALDITGGGNSGRWYIAEREIPATEWLLVEDVVTRKILWNIAVEGRIGQANRAR